MRGLLHHFAERLPAIGGGDAKYKELSLGEGGTPLLRLRHLPAALGAGQVDIWVKYEGLNPTASFKDRGMAIAVAAAAAEGIRCVICASTGNTSASAAAYAARARMTCLILLPAGRVAAGKVAQAVAHGATMLQIDGNFDDAMAAVKRFADSGRVAVVNSINPMRLQGQKTAAFEIIEDLGRAPDYHALPVGNAGNITAHWIGYCEAAGRGTAACRFCGGECAVCAAMPGGEKPPVMLGYQAAGAASFLHGGSMESPDTVATAIRIGKPQSYAAAQVVLRESGGWVSAVSDEAILSMQKNLAALEGVFCEPASAASVAGVVQDAKDGKFAAGACIVCTLTGHGLKDPDVFSAPPAAAVPVARLEEEIERHIAAAGAGTDAA